MEPTITNASSFQNGLQSCILTALTDGCRLWHIGLLREDPMISAVFGMELAVGDNTVRRFLQSPDPVLGAEWIAPNTEPMRRALFEPVVRDCDSTVQPNFCSSEAFDVWYSSGKLVRRSFHMLLAVVALKSLGRADRYRAGDTLMATGWREAMEVARC